LVADGVVEALVEGPELDAKVLGEGKVVGVVARWAIKAGGQPHGARVQVCAVVDFDRQRKGGAKDHRRR
jgi:hypothetical protein